jgi:hypothetical protein
MRECQRRLTGHGTREETIQGMIVLNGQLARTLDDEGRVRIAQWTCLGSR